MNEDEIETVPDYDNWPALCGSDEFEALIQGTIADYAPRVFAVVQELGVRMDGRIAAWGMAFEDGVFAVSAGSDTIHTFGSPEHAARRFARPATGKRPAITTRVVWR